MLVAGKLVSRVVNGSFVPKFESFVTDTTHILDQEDSAFYGLRARVVFQEDVELSLLIAESCERAFEATYGVVNG